jgi:CheY-like chemotaxis protein
VTRDDAEVAMLRVRDTGRGIPREMLRRIFDVFTQASPTLDRAQGGLGLGLTLVKNLVQMHGGSVAVQSEGSGRGSEFVVFLPILTEAERARCNESRVASHESRVGTDPSGPPPSSAGYPARDPRLATHSRRVLVVDDNMDAAATLADLLALWGHDVRVAHTGATALETAREYQPDMVLLDIGLPGMDGYEVARRLRECEEMRGILLVAITGYGQEEDRRRSQEAALDYHLTKPVDPEALQEVLAVH